MSGAAALILLLAVLLGPIAIHPIERNIEVFFLAIGILSALLAGTLEPKLAAEAIAHASPITIAVVAAGTLFSFTKTRFERAFRRLRSRISPPLLTGSAVLAIAILSSLITAIVAALVLVEVIEMLGLSRRPRINTAVAGCFAIGLGSVLTPLGGPLSALATKSLDLGFLGLLRLLGPFVLPGVAGCALIAGLAARGSTSELAAAEVDVRETTRDAVVQGLKIFAFVAGLILFGDALGPIASGYVGRLGDAIVFWANTVSAALDNSTLVVLELRNVGPERARIMLMSLLTAGGMLIPGNIPNIVCAGAMRIRSAEWARLGVPLGALLMGIYFAVLFTIGT